jgi:predicted metallopeptidase
MIWEVAPDLQKKVVKLVSVLKYSHIDPKRVVVFRSFGSKSKARARIWSLPRIWQQALKVKPHYCLEVLSEKFSRLTPQEQEQILIHELRHIPKNFSGSLLPHGRMRKK